jgi:hypothetical protein
MTVLVWEQENTILPSESKEHPVMTSPLIFIFCFNFNWESQKVMTTIYMDTYIYGMAIRGRTIYCCAGSKGIKMLNLNDKSISNINSNMSGVYYVATSGDKLYYTKPSLEDNSCLWRCPSGEITTTLLELLLTTYTFPSLSTEIPTGSGRTCYGQRHRQLLYFKDGLVLPCVLDHGTMLLVVNNSTTAFLFDVTGWQ